jgi:hypothetical protein
VESDPLIPSPEGNTLYRKEMGDKASSASGASQPG